MKKTVIIYGFVMALLLGILQYTQYKFMIRDISVELLVSLIAIVFIGIGIWLGFSIKHSAEVATSDELNSSIIQENLNTLNISSREYEILQWMNEGLSNQEIAEKLHISLSTVKSHIYNLYIKLDVKRRTQALQKARATNLI